MKKFIMALPFVIIAHQTFASGYLTSVSGEENINRRLEQYEETFAQLTEDRENLSFRDLAYFAGYFERSFQDPLTAEQNVRVEVLKEGYRQKVMTQPGHAKAVSRRLLSSSEIPGEVGIFRDTSYRSIPHEMTVLSYIKSHESVCEIARFLKDRRGEPGYPRVFKIGDESHPSLAFWASFTLSGMGLEGIPQAEMRSFGPEVMKTPELVTGRWVKWWEEIEAEQRTFSFPDDPQVYDINGPVKEDQSARPRPHKDSEQIKITGESRSAGESAGRSVISFREFFLAAGILVILALVLRWFLKRKCAV